MDAVLVGTAALLGGAVTGGGGGATGCGAPEQPIEATRPIQTAARMRPSYAAAPRVSKIGAVVLPGHFAYRLPTRSIQEERRPP